MEIYTPPQGIGAAWEKCFPKENLFVPKSHNFLIYNEIYRFYNRKLSFSLSNCQVFSSEEPDKIQSEVNELNSLKNVPSAKYTARFKAGGQPDWVSMKARGSVVDDLVRLHGLSEQSPREQPQEVWIRLVFSEVEMLT